MTPETSARVLILLSMAFGGLIAVLAVTDSGAIGTVAIVGGVVLGILWVAQAMFTRRTT